MVANDEIRTPQLRVDVTTGRIEQLFARAPHKVFFHLRDTLGAIMGSHRKSWLQRTKVKFKRRKDGTDLGTPKGSPTGSFVYSVFPKRKSVPKGQTPNLADIHAHSWSTSTRALGLETGGTFHPKGKYLTIPIGHALKDGKTKANFASLAALRRSGLANKTTIVTNANIGGRTPIVWLVKNASFNKKTGRRRRRKATQRSQVYQGEQFLPVFILVRSVRLNPLLKYYQTWDQLDSDRGKRLDAAMERAVIELEEGR